MLEKKWEIIEYPQWYTEEIDSFFEKHGKKQLDELLQRIDYLTDSPLKMAVLALLMGKQHIVGFGFTSQDGFWFPAQAFIFDCCSKVCAPTIRNPKGFQTHLKTQKHILNTLTKMYPTTKEEIIEEMPSAKMMLALDPDLETHTRYPHWNGR